MTSNGSLKEFILITNDEYCFLKNQPQHESKRLDYCEKQKQQFLTQVPASTSLNSESEGPTNPPIDKEQALIAQINLNSRFQDQQKPSKETSTSQLKTDYQQNNTPDKVLAGLIQPGLAGGKIERSRQILKAIQENNRVTVDEINQDIFLDEQDTSIGITDFLTALQVHTKQLPKQFLNLVEILARPQFLLANTYARQTSSRIQNRTAYRESPTKRLKLDIEAPSSWLTFWIYCSTNGAKEIVLRVLPKAVG